MDQEKRKQAIEQLDELRNQVSDKLGRDPQHHDPVAAHVEQVRTLLHGEPIDRAQAHTEASGLERRLLAWEAEHPSLVALAARVARVLEDAGL